MKKILVLSAFIIIFAVSYANAAYETLDLSWAYSSYHKELWNRGSEFGFGFENWFKSENQEIDGIPFKVGTQPEDAMCSSVPDVESFRIPVNKKLKSIYLLGSGLINHSNGILTNPDLFSVEIVYSDGTSEDDLPINLRSGQRAWYDWRTGPENASVTFDHPLTQ
ncbi:MAG: hypothetical protein M1426_05520, partial [Patescibacteria group bacterium]|nr:hypothetical protein [Patescibacteria group bacterium]